jgi:hypothetical protein
VIPGDTDYRIFSQDHGNIPSLDIIFLLGGYYYHTSYDTLDKLLYALHLLFWYIYILHWNSFVALFLSASSDAFECTHTRPGSIQARGDNLLSILKAFTNSSKLQSARERESKATTNDYKDERAVFFDYLSWFLVRCKIYDIFSIQCFILLS